MCKGRVSGGVLVGPSVPSWVDGVQCVGRWSFKGVLGVRACWAVHFSWCDWDQEIECGEDVPCPAEGLGLWGNRKGYVLNTTVGWDEGFA